MVATYRVIITDRAFEDLDGILSRIAADSPQNSAGVISRLLAEIEGLDQMPNRYGVARHSGRILNAVRSMPVPPHVVIYRVSLKPRIVYILRVRHGAMRKR
jgi:plasmid stabilization system protein ParE